MRFLVVLLLLCLSSCVFFLNKPKREDFLVNTKHRLFDNTNKVKPKKNGYYWYLTGDTLTNYERELDSINYGWVYERPAFYSGSFIFSDDNIFYKENPGLSSTPIDHFRKFLKSKSYERDDNYQGYYVVSDSIEMEYMYVDGQLVKKIYFEIKATLSSNADTLYVYYEKRRDGKFIRKLNAVCVFYPFPDTLN
jgi:hypothetical protein